MGPVFNKLGVVCSLMLALESPSALAQGSASAPPPAPAGVAPAGSLSESLTGMARAEYAAARVLYEDGDYQGAFQKLKSAHGLSRDPRLLWNMAACEKNLRHYSEVARLVERYLAEGGELVTVQDRADANALLVTVKGFISVLTVEVDQTGAEIFVDEQPVGTSPLPAPLNVDMGVRAFRVKKPGFLPFSTTQELPGGQPYRLTIGLVPEKHEGRLRVLAGPKDVIQVDGKTVGTGMHEGPFPSGTHSVYVTAPDKEPHKTDVVVQDNNLTTLHVTLRDEPRASVAEKGGVPAWVWIAGGAVLIAGGAGTYFLLKDNTTTYQTPTPGSWGEIPL